MGNSIYNSIGNNNLRNQFQTFKSNPLQFLIQKRINLPQEYANDPRGAVQYLMNQGQMSQQQFSQLSQMARQMGANI